MGFYESVERWEFGFNSVLGVYGIEIAEALSESVEHSCISSKYTCISVSGYLAEQTGQPYLPTPLNEADTVLGRELNRALMHAYRFP